jgi:hypothetical protein
VDLAAAPPALVHRPIIFLFLEISPDCVKIIFTFLGETTGFLPRRTAETHERFRR